LKGKSMKKRQAWRRMEWMRAFEETLTAIDPHTSGRIDWDTATFLFNSGARAIEAAHRYAQTMIDIQKAKP